MKPERLTEIQQQTECELEQRILSDDDDHHQIAFEVWMRLEPPRLDEDFKVTLDEVIQRHADRLGNQDFLFDT